MRPDFRQPHEAHGSSPRRPRRKPWAVLLALPAVGALVAGGYFASTGLRGPDSDQATLQGFQIRVLNVSQAAAENRLDGALDALEALERDLDDAAGRGLISAARYRGIDTALETVRADVTRTITAQSAAAEEAKAALTVAEAPPVIVPEPVPEPQPVQPQPVAPVAPAPVPVPTPQDQDQDKDQEQDQAQDQDLPDAAKEAKGKGKGAGKP